MFDLPFLGDLLHPWDIIRRTMTVLSGREKEYRKEYRALLVLVVWSQVNATTYKYHDRIIDAARKNGIPVRYLG